MKALNFVCRKTDKNYYSIANNAKDQIEELVRLKKSFQVNIGDPKRSGQQLKGYWVLIRIVKDWLVDQGNDMTDKQVSDYFKIEAGHYTELNGVKTAKSISNRSSVTVQEMEMILRKIESFGIEFGIEGCYLKNKEEEELFNWLKGEK